MIKVFGMGGVSSVGFESFSRAWKPFLVGLGGVSFFLVS